MRVLSGFKNFVNARLIQADLRNFMAKNDHAASNSAAIMMLLFDVLKIISGDRFKW
jgi:hypothetical protein